jgi:prepilin-type N-terminal cleavage/methylation domain-containing protein
MGTLCMEQKTLTAIRRIAGLSNAPRPAIRRMAASAFTLTELLVVIAIIAILASLITAAAVNAMRRGNEAGITTEIGQLAGTAERFKTEYGGAYPPNAMNNPLNNYKNQPVIDLVVNDFIRSFRKAFPRHNEPEGLLRRLAGFTGTLPAGSPTVSPLPGGINAAEAIYFWFGGFSSDPVFPISGPGGPSFSETNQPAGLDPADEILENRTPLYEFPLTQLGPRDNDGVFSGRFVDYAVDLNRDGDFVDPGETRRIHFWTYAPKGSESSFLYFDTSRHDPVSYDADLSGIQDLKIYAFKKVREGFSSSATPTPSDIHFVNKGKYQILHPGVDDTWGNLQSANIVNSNSVNDASNLLLFPSGPFTGDIADTLTNFTTGTLESAQE